MSRILLLIPFLILAGCRSYVVDNGEDVESAPRDISVIRDLPFEMRIGDRATVSASGLEFTLTLVTEDSRCSEGNNCLQPGKAGILLDITTALGDESQLILTIPGLVTTPYFLNAVLQHKGERFKLLRLDPYPRRGQPTSSSEYRALLVLEN